MDQCCKRISILGERQSQNLISPTLVSQLVKAGFFEGNDEAVMSLERKASIPAFYQRVLDNIHNLTPEQKERMFLVVEKYEKDMILLVDEKEHLNKEIIDRFGSPSDDAQQVKKVGNLA
jgi:hypothetical protein